MAAIAKLFVHGRSQAVRLPKEYRFEGTEVWGAGCEANLAVYLELWEGYLEATEGAIQ